MRRLQGHSRASAARFVPGAQWLAELTERRKGRAKDIPRQRGEAAPYDEAAPYGDMLLTREPAKRWKTNSGNAE